MPNIFLNDTDVVKESLVFMFLIFNLEIKIITFS